MDDSTIDRAVGRALARLRTARPGLTLESLGRAVSISASQLSGFETGARHLPAPAMWRLCAYFGVGPDAFFHDLPAHGVREDGAPFSHNAAELRALAEAAEHLSAPQIEAVREMVANLAPRPRGRGKPRGPMRPEDGHFSG